MEIKDIENLAELAKIKLSESEKNKLLVDMENILEYVRQIESAIEVKNVKPKHKLHNIWREDEIKSHEFSRDFIIEQFPDSQDNFLKVKKIL